MALYPEFLGDVSAEDLRLRFFAHIAELSAEEVDKLAHLDYRHEMAFVALDESTGQLLGLVRLKDELDEKTAEFAILVRSRLKNHGLGWLLMHRVIDYAKEKSLRRVYGDVLAENKGHAADVRRARLPRARHRLGHAARRARSRSSLRKGCTDTCRLPEAALVGHMLSVSSMPTDSRT
jgi:GNAT superfamily N-acetyltransferase